MPNICKDVSISLDNIETTIHAQIAPLLEEKEKREKRLRDAGRYIEANKLKKCCSKWRVFEVDGDLEVYPDRCKNRHCPVCADFYYRDLQLRMQACYAKMKHPKLLTLTMSDNSMTLNKNISFIKEDFFKLRRRIALKKAWTDGLWIVGITVGDNGRLKPHIHAIVDGTYFNQKTLSRLWYNISDSYIADIRNAPTDGITEYLSKHFATPSWANDLCDSAVNDLIFGLYHQRLVGAWGNCKKIIFRKEEKIERKYIGDLDTIVAGAYSGVTNCIDVINKLSDSTLMSIADGTVL